MHTQTHTHPHAADPGPAVQGIHPRLNVCARREQRTAAGDAHGKENVCLSVLYLLDTLSRQKSAVTIAFKLVWRTSFEWSDQGIKLNPYSLNARLAQADTKTGFKDRKSFSQLP
jgi:hypothetical protein